jgi:hypothetical protein
VLSGCAVEEGKDDNGRDWTITSDYNPGGPSTFGADLEPGEEEEIADYTAVHVRFDSGDALTFQESGETCDVDFTSLPSDVDSITVQGSEDGVGFSSTWDY